jgi:predicted RNA-binding protein with PUA-like domain
MAYWLIKSDPDTYSWDDLVRDKETDWTGIRNFQARNNLRLMKKGDLAFVYHSQEDKEIVGVAEIIEAAKPDPTAEDGDWVSVRIRAVIPCGRAIGLEEIRNTPGLGTMALVTHSRLSVQPVTEAQWNALLKYTKTTIS